MDNIFRAFSKGFNRKGYAKDREMEMGLGGGELEMELGKILLLILRNIIFS
jgi:hypothetical protein